MNIYQNRYNNALRWVARVNAIVASGGMVFDEDGDVHGTITVDDTGIYERKGNTRLMYFINDTSLDNGYHTTIADFDAYFAGWRFVMPADVHPLTKE